MPPGPAYNWFCVLYTTLDILSHAARHRACQLTPKTVASHVNPHKRRRTDPTSSSSTENVAIGQFSQAVNVQVPKNFTEHIQIDTSDAAKRHHNPNNASRHVQAGITESIAAKRTVESFASSPDIVLDQRLSVKGYAERTGHVTASGIAETTAVKTGESLLDSLAVSARNPEDQTEMKESSGRSVHIDPTPFSAHDTIFPPKPHNVSEGITEEKIHETEVLYPLPVSRNLQSSKVPSSRIGRLFHYGGLAASLGYGAASEVLRRTGSGSQGTSSVMMTEANIKRLVSKLSQMRGAALKLGQFMSIQDTHILPPDIDKIFRRVQDSAHYMPDWQMEQVMTSALGSSWADNFVSFDRIPFAAASIGQVHTAVLAAAVSPSGCDERVAVKIQFPNIANSIESDLGYIKILLTAGRLLPKGLFLDKTIQAMKTELADECDYVREASFLRSFGSPTYLGNDSRFKVPWVWDGSTSTVLVMERVDGVSVGEANTHNLTQQDRNDISSRVIELCLKELFEFRTMQTDPNWTNFLWNPQTRQVELVDFGATRTYSKEFMDSWFSILQAATQGDRDACIEWSLKVGYLTGEEDQVMLDAHVKSMTLLATPFKTDTNQPFSFGQGTVWSDITSEIRAQIPVMLQHRLTPPPKETYSLNRKLSGSFLLASRLGASIDTRAIWDKVVGQYVVG